MNFAILASFTILMVVTLIEIQKRKREQKKAEKDFWEREQEANNVRRKSLDGLNYIHIPWDTLPVQVSETIPELETTLSELHRLEEDKCVNLTGYTNTDLKLEYGTPNITELTQYDDNYALLSSALQGWGQLLAENGYPDEAVQVWEFAISTASDIRDTYLSLADIYTGRGDLDKLHRLKETASTLKSGNSKTILRLLNEKYL